MRTEKIGLKDFLYKRGVPEITDSQYDCGEGRRTVMYALVRCKRCNNLRRQKLFGISDRNNRWGIPNERNAATKALKFMEQTQILGQFRIME